MLYVYGVLRRRRLTRRLADRGLRLVTRGDLAALVGDAGEGVIEATRRNLVAHAEVVEEAFALATVLPFTFGTVFPDNAAVRDFLAVNQDLFDAELARHDSTEELTVTASYSEDDLLAELVAAEPGLDALRAAYRSGPSFENKLALGEAVAGALEARRQRDAVRVVDAVAPLALALREGELVSERAALSLSLLLERGGTPRVEERLERLRPELSRSLRFRLVGPLPPYSFVDLPALAAA